MKGVVLAGGTGSRLRPCTMVTNKHLLPVYDRPMIYYPLATLREAGLEEIMIVTGGEHAGHFVEILGNGEEFGCRLEYAVQVGAGGIAQALGLVEGFCRGESVAVILGDNIFSGDFKGAVESFGGGGKVFLKGVKDAERFGVAEVDEGGKVVSIEEKPKEPKSNLAVTGFYLYGGDVFEKIKKLRPSGRGELEITDVNRGYLEEGRLEAEVVEGEWTDAGTFESLYRATSLVREGKVRKPF